MRARIVIGANYGDEGKGLVTDYLCTLRGADHGGMGGTGVVVRFNGGAQAGHTVVTPEGVRHVHHHFGCGTLSGIPTFLSKYFVVNPIMFLKEADELKSKLTEAPMVFADPQCKVTTFVDMMVNQHKEDARGVKRHGSVGLGVHETMQRSQVDSLCITMADLWNFDRPRLEAKLRESCNKWWQYRTKERKPLAKADVMIDKFLTGCAMFAEQVHPAGIGQCAKLDPVFEGAQGLLLDQDNKSNWPHVTHSKTGLHNAAALCAQIGVTDLQVFYVSRTYLTRHGAGPLPLEDAAMCYADDTNLSHPYQGQLRFAPMEWDKLHQRIGDDFDKSAPKKGASFKLVLTHCDQLAPNHRECLADLYGFGPTRNDVKRDYRR